MCLLTFPIYTHNIRSIRGNIYNNYLFIYFVYMFLLYVNVHWCFPQAKNQWKYIERHFSAQCVNGALYLFNWYWSEQKLDIKKTHTNTNRFRWSYQQQLFSVRFQFRVLSMNRSKYTLYFYHRDSLNP